MLHCAAFSNGCKTYVTINIRENVFFGLWLPGCSPWLLALFLCSGVAQNIILEAHSGEILSTSWWPGSKETVKNWDICVSFMGTFLRRQHPSGKPPLNEIIPSSINIRGSGHSRSTLEQRRFVNMTNFTAWQCSAHMLPRHPEGWDCGTAWPL